MASIINRGDGRRAIQFENQRGERKTVGLGKCPKRDAESIKTKIEALIASKLSRQPLEPEVAEWVGKLPAKLAEKLAECDLIQRPKRSEEPTSLTLGDFLESYIVGRTDVKSRTTINLDQARKVLVAFFGASKPLSEISAGDAEDFSRWLRGGRAKPLSDNTARRHCGRARQFFAYAVRKRYLTANPFADAELSVFVKGNSARLYEVSLEAANQVLAACPNTQWRLLFALARFGGLRTPSEPLALRWSDVDWEHNRLRVPCPKLEHIEGKGERIIPIFPELRPHLEAAFDEAEEGAVFVITEYRDPGQNLRTQFGKIIQRAGLKPWPRLWQNLRATRETELASSHPLHVVCEWIGNSESVAKKHYLSVREEEFQKAITKSAAPALQNPAAGASNASHEKQASSEKPPVFQGVAAQRESVRNKRLPPLGVEPRTC